VRIAVGTDEVTTVTEAVERHLTAVGHEVVDVANGKLWPDVGRDVAAAVADGAADRGLVWCWTGTGVSMAANKVAGVRAALCADAQTAAGARRWNDANVLALSNRATSPAVAGEVVGAFLATDEVDPAELANIDGLG
jgi:ribose 5-phosphate isomerase B